MREPRGAQAHGDPVRGARVNCIDARHILAPRTCLISADPNPTD
jgi:hypothetical protein